MINDVVPWLLAGLPLLGAAASLSVWSRPDRLKFAVVFVSMISLGATIALARYMKDPSEGLLLLSLLPLAAGVSILGQPAHRDHRLSWIMTLLFLGLAEGVLTHPGVAGQMMLLALLGGLIMLLYRHHTPLWPISWWGIGVYTFGVLSVIASAVADPPLSAIASLIACAVLLPLVPFHKGHLTALTRLPGSLPSFMALLLPVLGLHRLARVISTVPEVVAQAVVFLALAGSLYGAIKALAQSRIRLLLAYGSLSFFSILWWFVATMKTGTIQAAVFVGTVGLVTSGLLVAWQVIRTRYGDDVDPQAVSGLAFTMPSYAVLLSLLALAAMGLPPFGVFAGFMGLLLTSPVPSALGLCIVLVVWLSASWYVMQMAQQLLFGVRRSDLGYTDLLRTEFASLLILVLVLLFLGLAPSSLWQPQPAAPPERAEAESIAWNR